MRLWKNSGKKSLRIFESFNILKKRLNFYEAKEILSFITGEEYPYLFFKDVVLSDKKIRYFIDKRLKEKIPLQYLVKRARFKERYFYIEKGVFIPRPETELLVEKAIDLINKGKIDFFLEIGTGSGCITGTILAELENIRAVATDISRKAIKVSEINFKNLGVLKRVDLKKCDIYKGYKRFPLVIVNPPYISLKEKFKLQKEVSKEPKRALFSGIKGTEFIEKILKDFKKVFKKNAYFLFEIGYNQKSEILDILKENGFRFLNVYKDFNSIERVVLSRCGH